MEVRKESFTAANGSMGPTEGTYPLLGHSHENVEDSILQNVTLLLHGYLIMGIDGSSAHADKLIRRVKAKRIAHLSCISAEFLAQSEGSGVLCVCAANLDDVAELLCFGVQRFLHVPSSFLQLSGILCAASVPKCGWGDSHAGSVGPE